ncbi:glycosyltransferase [Gloeothece verrucosa]|uniref:Glycosyl transferase family 2 n=1 Tax=Gloeothece verrucosa (strain PCC 7822) TaxID=497965 RepID=E0U588_GLOV7|nr:glycosyltransferase [Gloeothece verrucosa]ADN12367.1 glycosyl transferase family 2 [Gloeothece verrucosa PCC 7822]
MNNPALSVIIPIYNGEADLPDLIECLRSQTYPKEQVEYLLVDNNSSDQTGEILQTTAVELANQGIKLTPLTEKDIQSSYAARNRAIRFSHHSILVFTDADCRPQSDWLEQLVKPFSNPNIGIVAGELVALEGNSLLEQYADLGGTLSAKYLLEHPFCPYGQTANLAIKKQAFEKVGLFRPYLTTGGDADICWRIQQQTDWKIDFAPLAIVRHRHRATLKEFRSQWRRYGSSNRYLHQLYGVDLMRDFTAKEAIYRLSRWIIKEIPIDSLKMMQGQASLVHLLKTPIDLLGFQARSQGQKESLLSEKAREIEWL